MASAPSSLLSGDALPDISLLDLTFRPQLGEMASLALPTNLPLAFVADIQVGTFSYDLHMKFPCLKSFTIELYM